MGGFENHSMIPLVWFKHFMILILCETCWKIFTLPSPIYFCSLKWFFFSFKPGSLGFFKTTFLKSVCLYSYVKENRSLEKWWKIFISTTFLFAFCSRVIFSLFYTSFVIFWRFFFHHFFDFSHLLPHHFSNVLYFSKNSTSFFAFGLTREIFIAYTVFVFYIWKSFQQCKFGLTPLFCCSFVGNFKLRALVCGILFWDQEIAC